MGGFFELAAKNICSPILLEEKIFAYPFEMVAHN
jgi:hypothetical protein